MHNYLHYKKAGGTNDVVSNVCICTDSTLIAYIRILFMLLKNNETHKN